MALNITTHATCRHCAEDLAQAVRPGQPPVWVHYLTRLPECANSSGTTAEPVTLEVVR